MVAFALSRSFVPPESLISLSLVSVIRPVIVKRTLDRVWLRIGSRVALPITFFLLVIKPLMVSTCTFTHQVFIVLSVCVCAPGTVLGLRVHRG